MITLEELTIVRAPIERCFDLARSVEVHLAGNVHWGEQAVATKGVTSGLIGAQQKVTWRAKHFGIWFTLTSQISAFQPPVYFQDVMLSGPFRTMRHDHDFQTLPDGSTEMRDSFAFSAPIPPLGVIAEELVLRRYMRDLLQERNRAIKEAAESSGWQKYLEVSNANPHSRR